MTDKEFVIVSRHIGAVEWLSRQGIHGRVISHATPEDVVGKVVIGNLPLHLAALAEEVWAIDMPGLSSIQRGGELTADDMERAGARLRRYKVTALS